MGASILCVASCRGLQRGLGDSCNCHTSVLCSWAPSPSAGRVCCYCFVVAAHGLATIIHWADARKGGGVLGGAKFRPDHPGTCMCGGMFSLPRGTVGIRDTDNELSAPLCQLLN